MPTLPPAELFAEVSAVLFRVDPMGLNYETNTDEYDPETREILARIGSVSDGDQLQMVLHQVFSMMFDPAMAGPLGHYREAAEQIWALWQRHSSNLD